MSGKQKVSSCIHCRQMKMKCDAKQLFPAPCSRCAKQHLTCLIDPLFQRTEKRKRLNALERELTAMKAAAATSPQDAAATGPARRSAEPSHPLVATQESTSPRPVPSLTLTAESFSAQRIAGVQVGAAAIADILNCFFSDYHPEFPILPHPAAFVEEYDSNALLFWAMIAIASKHMNRYASLHLALEEHVHGLATQPSLTVDHPLGTVQALLLLCFYSFNFQASNRDPSWNYAGTAYYTALRFGLHRPQHFSDFVYNDRLDEAGIQAFRRAWIGCFIINQTLASELGVPSTVHPDFAIHEALRSPSPGLPDVLRQHLKIAFHSYSVCQALGNDETMSDGLNRNPIPMIRAFDTTLQSLQTELAMQLAHSTEMALLRVEMQLYSFALREVMHSYSGNTPDSRASEYLVKAGIVAARVVEAACRDTSRLFWPSVTRMAVVYATHFLMKLSAIPGHVDEAVAKNSVSQAWSLLKSRSETEHDHLARICAIIAYLSRTESAKETSSSVSVKARMASNLSVDAIWRARSRFSRNVHEVKPSDYTATAAMEDLIQSMSDGAMESYFFDDNFTGGSEDVLANGFQYQLPLDAANTTGFQRQLKE